MPFNFANNNVVVTAIVHLVGSALKAGERVWKYRHTVAGLAKLD
jgi:hypothetical protein